MTSEDIKWRNLIIDRLRDRNKRETSSYSELISYSMFSNLTIFFVLAKQTFVSLLFNGKFIVYTMDYHMPALLL